MLHCCTAKNLSQMPGTILLSVLEFMGLDTPPSWTPPQFSIKVSMGKREYQGWDNQQFSIPLATLRDNLVITLHDARGNVISHTDIQTRLVVEKGAWDDMFPLEGGGQLHLKLQFILSQEERHRIRIMRESALRKKHGELMSGSFTSAKNVNIVRRSLSESSLSLHQEVSESSISLNSENLVQNEAIAMKAGIGTKKIEAAFPIDVKKLHQPFISQGSNVDRTELSQRGLNEKGKLISPERNEDGTVNVEKHRQVRKTPSSIKNMISAFESSVAQGTRPPIKPPPAKLQLNKLGTEASLRSSNLNETKTETFKPEEPQSVSSKVKSSLLVKEPQQAATYARQEGDQLSSIRTFSKDAQKEANDVKEVKIPSDNVIRASTNEAATVSGRRLDEHILGKGRNSDGKSPGKESKGIDQKYLPEVDNQRVPYDNMEEKENWEENQYSSNCPGMWMFPAELSRVCITTSCKETIDIIECCHSEAESDGRKASFAPESAEKRQVACGGDVTAKKEGKKTYQKSRKSNIDNSADNETSGGSMGQAVRVAMIIGFAVFVFFTRERKN